MLQEEKKERNFKGQCDFILSQGRNSNRCTGDCSSSFCLFRLHQIPWKHRRAKKTNPRPEHCSEVYIFRVAHPAVCEPLEPALLRQFLEPMHYSELVEDHDEGGEDEHERQSDDDDGRWVARLEDDRGQESEENLGLADEREHVVVILDERRF